MPSCGHCIFFLAMIWSTYSVSQQVTCVNMSPISSRWEVHVALIIFHHCCSFSSYKLAAPRFFQGVQMAGDCTPTTAFTAHSTQELMHQQWKILLDDEFLEAWKHVIVILCPDGVLWQFYLWIFTYSVDYCIWKSEFHNLIFSVKLTVCTFNRILIWASTILASAFVHAVWSHCHRFITLGWEGTCCRGIHWSASIPQNNKAK